MRFLRYRRNKFFQNQLSIIIALFRLNSLFRLNTIARVIVPIMLCCMVVSCSVEKNTSLSRNYHNLVSHYNIYFNGHESYKKGIDRARESVQLNFNNMLPVFLYQEESVNTAVTGDMKRAIDKATKVIAFHSITTKPKVKEGDQSAKDRVFFEKNEYNKWVDDSYLLMGKAYMYQGEYFMATETFKHILVTFPAEPIRFLAMTWLARAYIMIDEIREAERILTTLADETAFPEEYLVPYHTTWAQYHIAREAYDRAAENLETALERKGVDKEDKIRYTYILAQLYKESGENELALKRYQRVTRYNPPYEMAFSARVNMAEVFESGSGNSEDLKKLLNRMLRDSKNTEYRDQIYFALGNIAMEEGNRVQAIEYYQLSVSTSVQNNFQKGSSSLTLAKLFYEEPDYILSAAYYDSAVSFLDEDYPGYRGLATLSASLSGLVGHVRTFELEDSVQMLAALPEPERLAIIDGIIEEVRQREEEARLAEQEAMQNRAFNQTMMSNNPQGGNTGQEGGKWYFYNLNAKSFGQPEFRMKWGQRTLEDHWRRSNKQIISSGGDAGGTEGDTTEAGDGTVIFDNKSREFYLAQIPLTDSAMEQSHLQLEDALFQMGQIYRENLLDYDEAIEAFSELLERYPDTRHGPPVHYYLYDLYNSTRETSSAEYHKQELISRYPRSHFAMLLNNPNYLQELEQEEKRVERYYEGVYESYREGDHKEVIIRADTAMNRFEGDPLVPKFLYIKALSTGALLGREEMKAVLDTLISRYPATEEGTQAQELVSFMFVEFPEIREAAEVQEAEETYTGYDPGQEHYFLLALSEGVNVNQVSFDLLNYNLDNFNPYDLQIERLELTDSYQMLVVQSFTSAEAAERYLRVMEGDRDQILSGIGPSAYRMMTISLDNFTILSEKKLHNPYYIFYRKEYRNEEE